MASDRESKPMDERDRYFEAKKKALKNQLKNQNLKRLKMWCPPPLGPPVVRVVKSQWQNEGLGVDLICNSCRQHIPKSQTFITHCQFFRPVNSPSNVRGTPPLTRWFARCPNCKHAFKLVRNSDSCIFISGATLHQHGDEVIDCKSVPDKKEIYDLDWNDSHPDVVLQSSSTARALLDRPPLPINPMKDKEYREWRLETVRLQRGRVRGFEFSTRLEEEEEEEEEN